MATTLKDAVSAFGVATKAKLSNPAVRGAPEDQLRGPLEAFIAALSDLSGLPNGALALVGESSLSEIGSRPDYAATIRNALVGFIEVKAPGKGADPRRFTDPHDREQWTKLKSLPNLLYTDGNAFSLWRDGTLTGAIVQLDGDVVSAGASLSAPLALVPLISDFLQWRPIPPRTPKQLAEVAARLCRLLREEVTDLLNAGGTNLNDLAIDWRMLLFPHADDKEFADGYAQAVTFGLLVARAQGISLEDGIDAAARRLKQTNSLIGTALGLLTDDPGIQKALFTSLSTLARVLSVVDWEAISRGDADAWLYFYEDFLAVYDNALRKRTGSYYTPPEVVTAMTGLVDEALRSPDLFGRVGGLASPDVVIADPAVGAGTFLLGVLRRIANTIEADQGAGAVPAAIRASVNRLIGFELQFGPFVVAELRLLAELHRLVRTNQPLGLRLFITDTLGNPFAEEERIPQILQAVGRSRREANAVKRDVPITVVIGNPPYKEKARGRGDWIEQGAAGIPAPMAWWSPPVEWGVGAHAKHLKNLYVYFWRWATWKVFGSGVRNSENQLLPERQGIICFITVAGFLNGPGFERMRDDLRRSCSHIWVIDCSPEGHQPEVGTRIFQGVQQPVCIVMATRSSDKPEANPAQVRFRALPEGRRQEKFTALATIALDQDGWVDCPTEWRAPFLPAAQGLWGTLPTLESLFIYNGSGVMPGRTWVIAPDADSLRERWDRLIQERDLTVKETLFHPHQGGDKSVGKETRKGLFGHEFREEAITDDSRAVIAPVRYAARSFDRQWIIPDNRLINRPNPRLWSSYSPAQIHLTALEAHAPSSGPAVTFSGLIPDLHHYKGSFGGRVYLLWSDRAGTQSNVRPALLAFLAAQFGFAVGAEDVMAYLAATMAHPAFTARFAEDLVQPGLRVPITADPELFARAVELGREVLWLHCYGERCVNAGAGRPAGPPRLPREQAPRIPADGAIPGAPDPLPENMDYDAATCRLRIGRGFVENVTPAMWDYEVSGKHVLRQWFSYRRLDRSKPLIGDKRDPSPLERLQPQSWPAEYTSDLIDLLHVLGRVTALEPAQAALLEAIVEGPRFGASMLEEAGALARPANTQGESENADDQRQGSLAGIL